MASVNKVILIGRLGADPELKTTSHGPVTTFSVATDRKWRDGDGDLQSETQWTRITVFGKRAVSSEEYLSKGQQVYVEGRLRTSSWEDRDGNKRWSTDVVAKDVVFLGKPSGKKSNTECPPEVDRPFTDDDIPF